LIPADADADRRVPGPPHPKAGVTRIEVELLGVPNAVGDVALAVDAELSAVRVDDDHRVERGVVRAFVDADRQDDVQLRRQLLEMGHRRMTFDGKCASEMLRQHVDAEVRTLEQLGDQHDLSTDASGLANETVGGRDVVGDAF